jgi:hypothetical protein
MSNPKDPFRYFNSSPEVIRMAVMLYRTEALAEWRSVVA